MALPSHVSWPLVLFACCCNKDSADTRHTVFRVSATAMRIYHDTLHAPVQNSSTRDWRSIDPIHCTACPPSTSTRGHVRVLSRWVAALQGTNRHWPLRSRPIRPLHSTGTGLCFCLIITQLSIEHTTYSIQGVGGGTLCYALGVLARAPRSASSPSVDPPPMFWDTLRADPPPPHALLAPPLPLLPALEKPVPATWTVVEVGIPFRP